MEEIYSSPGNNSQQIYNIDPVKTNQPILTSYYTHRRVTRNVVFPLTTLEVLA